MHLLLCLFSFVSFSTAHFILQYPHSLGFDDANEGTAPCGGFSVSFNDSDDSVPVGGFPVSMLSTHPASDWLFRATLDQKEPFNWTNLLPVVSETGLGQFCLPNLKAPDEFTGKTGLLQIVQHGPDGILYQCAPVNFVQGVNNTVGSSCQNVTGLTAIVTNQDDFTSSSSASGSSSMSMASSTSSSTSSSTASASAASASSSGLAVATSVPSSVQNVLVVLGLAVPLML